MCKLIGGTANIAEEILSLNEEDLQNPERAARKMRDNIDNKQKYYKEHQQESFCLIIDGKTLAFVFSEPKLKSNFFRLGKYASSVICCRVSPKQKAEVVRGPKEVKDRKEHIVSLAIGDGANDVPMILEANIGVGIKGKEGTQVID